MTKQTKNSKHTPAFTIFVVVVIIPSIIPQVMAQVVPADSNLNSLTPVNGSIWDLQGNAFLSNGTSASFAKPLPTGTPGLTINGASGGSSITMSDGAAHFGFFSGNIATLNLSNVTLTGGSDPNGGVINTTGALTLNTSGAVSLLNNAATGNGGAIFSNQSLTVNGALTANGNRAGSSGGALFSNAGTVTVTGGVIMDSNIAGTGAGGAIRATGGDLNLASTSGNVSLTNNIAAANGGALLTVGAGSGNVSVGNAGGTVIITGNRSGFNAAGNLISSTATGGAINAIGTTILTGSSIILNNNISGGTSGGISSQQAVTMSGNLTANGNQALNGAAGAIRAVTGDVTVTGATSLDSNSAASNTAGGGTSLGGGIYAVNGSVNLATSAGDVTLTNNTASSHGGAVAARVIGNITLGNGSGNITVIGNKAGFSSGASPLNTVSNGGGLYGAGSITLNGSTTTLAGNIASGIGGAIYTSAGDITVNGSVTVDRNLALNGTGGGINTGNGNVNLATTSGDVTLTNNFSGGIGGGAVFARGTGVGNVTIGNSAGTVTITGNQVGLNVDGSNAVNAGNATGGAIYAAGSNGGITLTGRAITLSDNHANQGGGLYASEAVLINGDLIAIGNTASDGAGGAIYGASVTINGAAMFDHNSTATRNGGAIFSPGAVAFTDATKIVTLTNNKSFAAGGGVSSDSDITVAGGAMLDHNAVVGTGVVDQGGGALRTRLGNVSVAASPATGNVSLTNNVSGHAAGGIYAGGNLTLGNATGTTTITGNSAGYNFDANNNATTATNDPSSGGAIYSGANTALTGQTVILQNNKATASGGGVFSAQAVTVDGSLSASGNSARDGNGGAIYAAGDFALSANGNSNFSNNSAGGKGGAIWGGGNVTLNAIGGDITFSGNSHVDPQANAIYLDNTSGATTTTFNAVAGRAITFFDPVQSNAANGLVSVLKTGEGLLSFDASNYSAEVDRWSKVYGNTQVQAGTFEVANNAIYGARMADVSGATPSSFVVNSGATLAGGVAGTVRTDQFSLGSGAVLDIAGRQPAVRGTFTVDSASATFGSGSRIFYHTKLNDAVVQDTDLLVLEHAASSGSALLQVTNVGGEGAVTVGNGIKVVDAINGATTPATNFALAGPVYAGPYQYSLERSSVDGSNDQAWYLRSTIDPEPPGPTPPGPHPAPVPRFRPQTSLYAAVPALALVYTRTLVDTLHERVGEERLNQGEPKPADEEQTCGPSLGWGRLIYRSGEQEGKQGILLGDTPKYNYDLSAFQVGVDLYRDVKPDGSHDLAGVSLAVGNISAGVDHYGDNAGDDTLRAYSLGAYWTHFGQAGWYLDGVLQLHRFDIEAKPTDISKLKTNGWGYTASVEAGYPFEVKKDLYVEPQAQVIYSSIDLDNSDDLAANVRFEDVDSLIGRLGVRIAKDWETEGTDHTVRRTNAWIRPSVWHEFKGQPKTEFSSQNGYVPFEADIGGTWGEVNVGVDYQANARTTFTVSTGYRQAFDGDSHGYDGMLGVKVAF